MKKWIICTAAALALFGAAATAEAKPPAPPHDPPGAGAPRHPGPHKAPPHKDPPPPPPHKDPPPPSDDSQIHVEINL